MILDTSALLAILLREPEAAQFAKAMEDAPVVRMSVASFLEAAVTLERRRAEAPRLMLDAFVEEFGIRLEPVTVEQMRFACEAFRYYGKGIHPAGLNYGDCFTYALARALREPVLFKGEDFSRTDVRRAVDG